MLSGARVVRIAVHPEMPRQGYGSRALELLRRYYQGELADLVSALFHSTQHRRPPLQPFAKFMTLTKSFNNPPVLDKDNTLAPLFADSAHMWCVSRLEG